MFTDFITGSLALSTPDHLHLTIASLGSFSRNTRPDVRLSCSFFYRTTSAIGFVRGILQKNRSWGRARISSRYHDFACPLNDPRANAIPFPERQGGDSEYGSQGNPKARRQLVLSW